MRSLPSIQGQSYIKARLNFSLQDIPTPGNTLVFSAGDIQGITPIEWAVPFGGGFGIASKYEITLSSSLGGIKSFIGNVIGREATLRVDVNSDTFYPHKGRVRHASRVSNDPNLLILRVFDLLQSDDPPIPLLSSSDNYSEVHLEDLALGQPILYGKYNARVIPYVAVNSYPDTFLLPNSISFASAIQTSSRHFQSNLANGGDTDNIQAVNVTADSGQWLATDAEHPTNPKIGLFTQKSESNSFHSQIIQNRDLPIVGSNKYVDQYFTEIGAYDYSADIAPMEIPIDGLSFLTCSIQIIQRNSGVESFTLTRVALFVNSGDGEFTTNIFSVGLDQNQVSSLASFNFVHPLVTYMWPGSAGYDSLSPGRTGRLQLTWDHTIETNSKFDVAIFCKFTGRLLSSSYKRYSVFIGVDSTGNYVSENPFAILDDIFSHFSSTPYLSLQSSNAQIDVQSFAFHCLFAEREELSKIVEQFGRQARTYVWAGDSGMVNYRTYQESGTIVDSALTDATIGVEDIINLELRENPLGTSLFGQQQYSKFTVRYNFDFQKNAYQNSVVANKNNNALCESANAAKVTKALTSYNHGMLDSQNICKF